MAHRTHGRPVTATTSGGAPPPPLRPRRTRADGARSRSAILREAAMLATTRGLEGFSIGELAEHLGMSKSGLYAHFDSKEELELATIETAAGIFDREVIGPAMAAAAGRARLMALIEAFLSHLERGVFPGGCFFAAAAGELDTRPGKARERVCAVQRRWIELLAQCIGDAQRAGEFDARADVEQMTFEIEAMMLAANSAFVMTGEKEFLERARQGVRSVLERASAKRRARPGARGTNGAR